MDITITVTGMDELIKKCNDPAVLNEPMRGFFTNATLEVQRNVQTFAPVDTGQLRASITTLVDTAPMPLFGLIGTNLQPHYAPDMEYGTPPHYPPIAALIGWAHRHGMNPYALQRKIARYGTSPRQFFQKGAQASMGKIDSLLQAAGQAIEDKWGSN